MTKTKTKTFPNGFTNWIETYYEIVSFIVRQQTTMSAEDSRINRVLFAQGTGGLYELAEQWTDEFESDYHDLMDDGEFFDMIEEFCNKKNSF